MSQEASIIIHGVPTECRHTKGRKFKKYMPAIVSSHMEYKINCGENYM